MVQHLKWCPQIPSTTSSGSEKIGRLGVLAAAVGDGSVLVYSIRNPLENQISPKLLNIKPNLRIACDETRFWNLCWNVSADGVSLMMGSTKGSIGVKCLDPLLQQNTCPDYLWQITNYSTPITSIAVFPGKPELVAVGDYTGKLRTYNMKNLIQPTFLFNCTQNISEIFWIPGTINCLLVSEFGTRILNTIDGTSFKPPFSRDLVQHETPRTGSFSQQSSDLFSALGFEDGVILVSKTSRSQLKISVKQKKAESVLMSLVSENSESKECNVLQAVCPLGNKLPQSAAKILKASGDSSTTFSYNVLSLTMSGENMPLIANGSQNGLLHVCRVQF